MKEKRLERELEKEREGMWDRVRDGNCLTKRGLERERERVLEKEREKENREMVWRESSGERELERKII